MKLKFFLLFLFFLFLTFVCAQQTDIDSIITHLQFLGYTCEHKTNKIVITHQTKLSFDIVKYKGGLLVKSWFSKNTKSKQDINSFLHTLNTLNANSTVCRFYINEKKDLSIEAYYPLPYTKQSFSAFLEMWQNDFETILKQNYKELSKHIE